MPKTESRLDQSLLQHIYEQFKNCDDLERKDFPDLDVTILYFGHMVDFNKLSGEVIDPFLQIQPHDLDRLFQSTLFVPTTDEKQLVKGILAGNIALFHQKNHAYLIDAAGAEKRSITPSETESVITGPHDAFLENAEINLALIRRRVHSSHLKVVRISVGEITKTDIYILYIQDIANQDFVQQLIERIQRIEADALYDTHMLIQYIDDSPLSLFPQFLTSERPDSAVSKLVEGRVIGVMDGSPSIFSAPTSLFEFFTASDDYYQRWIVGSATRVLRLAAFIITVYFTALYVALTTYHYEMIPEKLLLTLVESRSRVPFPPLYEALLMELTIELLREAGARLPTKIGQTIGIVGGIVIGQAAVQAGFTSNILIISVAASAIASFVIPSYTMSASIRLLRFGLILLAGLWGNLGLALGTAWIVTHLSGLTSLGASYLNPVAPFRLKDWKDVFIRAPFMSIRERPTQTKSPNPVRQKMRK